MTEKLSAVLCALYDGAELDARAPRDPPKEVRLFRAGANRTLKGTFLFDEKAAESVRQAADDWAVRLAFDYAHAMLRASTAPDPAEAGKSAGWFSLGLRDGELWATDIEWTDAAAAKIRAREFRYVSPAFAHDADKRVLAITNVALTNIPATKAAAPLTLDASDVVETEESRSMKGVLALLGLSADAPEDRAIAAVESFRAQLQELSAVTGKPAAEALGVVRAWKASHERVESLSAEVKALRKVERDRAIAEAVKAGKLAPAQKAWAEAYGDENPAGLRAYLDAAPVLVPMHAEAKAPAADAAPQAAELSAIEAQICERLMIAPEAFLKNKAAQAKRAQ